MSHYAFHLAVLLTLDGVNQWALFSVANQQVQDGLDAIEQAATTFENDTAKLVQITNNTLARFSLAPNTPLHFPVSINNTLNAILRQANVTHELASDLLAGLQLYGFKSYGYSVE